MKNKLIASMLLLCVSISLLGCGNTAATSTSEEIEETENTENEITMIEGGVYLEDFVNSEYIEYLSSHKNKNYEIQINPNGYTEDELFEVVAPTVVYIENITESHHKNMSGGNIYDIDDDYIYVLSCAHGFSKDDATKELRLTFVTNEIITIPYENVSFCEKDYTIYKIPKNILSNETLNSLKSINIDNFLNKTKEDFEKNTTLYLYRYNGEVWTTYFTNTFSYLDTCFTSKNDTKIKGCSGFGLFDKDGTYYGPNLKNKVYFYSFIYYVEDLITQHNKNYFDEQ